MKLPNFGSRPCRDGRDELSNWWAREFAAGVRSGLVHGVPMLKTSSICFVLIIASGWPASGVYGAPAGSADISVREAAGIRRNNYPVSSRVPLAKGELKDPSAVRLLLN